MTEYEKRLTMEDSVHQIKCLAEALHIISYATGSKEDFDRHNMLADAIWGIETAIREYAERLQELI